MKISSTWHHGHRNAFRPAPRPEHRRYQTQLWRGRWILLAPEWRKRFSDGIWLVTETYYVSSSAALPGPHTIPSQLGHIATHAISALVPFGSIALDYVGEALERRARERELSEPEQPSGIKTEHARFKLSGSDAVNAIRCQIDRHCYIQLPDPSELSTTHHHLPTITGSGAVAGNPQWLASAPVGALPSVPSQTGPLYEKLVQTAFQKIIESKWVHLTDDGQSIVLSDPDTVGDAFSKTRFLIPQDIGHIAVSYSSDDQALVRELCGRLDADLRDKGLHVWFDDYIPPGREWASVLEDRFSSATLVIVVMTESSQDSEWVRQELDWAASNEKAIIPLAIDGFAFDFLPQLQSAEIDREISRSPSDKEWAQLIDELELVVRRSHSGLPPPSE